MNDKDKYEDNYSELRALIAEQFSQQEVENIDKAYNVASEAHYGQLRYSGQPYIIHPIAVAKILLELGMDSDSIVVAFLHDTVEDTPISLTQIKEMFGEEIASLVDGVTKLGKVPLSTKEEQQAENIRKMLLAMSVDIRVIIIKLADRLHNMRTLDFMRPQKRRDKALETIEIYAPIAHRLGIRAIKEELEDLAISYLDPIAYKEIANTLNVANRLHKNFIDDMIKRIQARVDEVVPGAHIDGRTKSIHGIYRKMYIQNRNFDEIYDIYAIRIIVESVIDCYNCLGVIHDMFHSLPGRFKDYISTPKSNMYQSLHTTVICSEDGIPFEIQIRTWEMHYTAEYGIAAHWKYKLGIDDNSKFEERLTWIRQLLESQNDSEDVEEIVRTIKSDFVPDDVFVFTPKGDVINIPSGATVVDFAYAIHSEVGNHMVGAKVDGRIVPLDYKVKTGQIVEVLTSPAKGPSRDWFNFVATSSARTKIRNWFKKERRPENISEGKLEIEREFRRNNIRLHDEELGKFLLKLSQRQKCKSIDDFYAAIGYGSISINRLMPYIKEEYYKILKSNDPPEIDVVIKQQTRKSAGVIVEGVDNCLIKFSRCCNPLPGDDIIGFITRGHGVSIHKRDCSNVPQCIPLANEPERWINVKWDNNVKEEFKSTLSIECIDRIGLIADLSSQLATMHVMIHSLNSRQGKSGKCIITMTITVNGVEHLKNVTKKLEKTNGVLNIKRSGV